MHKTATCIKTETDAKTGKQIRHAVEKSTEIKRLWVIGGWKRQHGVRRLWRIY